MVSFTCLAYTSTDFDTGVHRNFSRGETSAFCLCFSSCSRCNKNGPPQNTLLFLPPVMESRDLVSWHPFLRVSV